MPTTMPMMIKRSKSHSRGKSTDLTYYRPSAGVPLAVSVSAIGQGYTTGNVSSGDPVTVQGPVAIVEVRGPLDHYGKSYWESYESLQAKLEPLAQNPNVRCVLIDLDTPGGAVAGCFELVRYVRQLFARQNKRIVTFAQNALSAGYALASMGGAIFAAPSGTVGSIGVIEQIVDETAYTNAMGVNVALIASGQRKADGHPQNPLTVETVEAYQKSVNAFALQFFDLVSECRPQLTSETVQGFDAATYTAAEALALGLVDGIMAKADLIATLIANPDWTLSETDDAMGKKIISSAGGFRASAASAASAEGPKDDEKPGADASASAEGDDGEKHSEPDGDEGEGGEPDYDKKIRALLSTASSPEEKAKMFKKIAAAIAEPDSDEPAAAAAAAQPQGARATSSARGVSIEDAAVDRIVAKATAKMADAQARAQLLAGRNLPPAVQAAASKLPLADAQALVASFPIVPSTPIANAVAGLQGAERPVAGQTGFSGITHESNHAAAMDRAMGFNAGAPTVSHEGNVSTFRVPLQARAFANRGTVKA